MPREVRTFAEGSLRWVQASGTGGWATASAPQSALVGFVQAGAAFGSGATYAPIRDRGIPHHFKFVSKDPPTIQFTYLQALTANMPAVVTAVGASTPQLHFELKQATTEDGGGSAQYYQFMNGVFGGRNWAEQPEGNQVTENWQFLTMLGPTGSGYLG